MVGREERRREDVGDRMKRDRVSCVPTRQDLFLSHVARFAYLLACICDLIKLV
jgi:hypothetical protein